MGAARVHWAQCCMGTWVGSHLLIVRVWHVTQNTSALQVLDMWGDMFMTKTTFTVSLLCLTFNAVS